MTGRFDSTQDRRRARHRDGAGRRAATLAMAALLAVAGSAWAQATKAQGPAGPRIKKVTVAPTEAPAASPGIPDLGPSSPSPLPSGDAPPPGAMAIPSAEGDRPRRDDRVEPAEAAEEKDPLKPAKEPPGGARPAPGKSSGADFDPFALQPDRLGLGKQRVQLSVEVQANPVINLGKESTVRLVVTNESNLDASGVSVVYQLPEGLEYVSSNPEATPVPGDKALYHWKKPMLAALGEWVILVKVVARSSRACEHAATVTAKAGSRANTTVQEPKLKVEATASPGRLLKGNQVTFAIAVHNPGTGPAKNVIVQAKLSSGLRLGNDDIVEQVIDEIKPGERVPLEPLIVDTVAGGQQTCTVDVRSPDVNTVVEDQRVVRNVDVTKPELTVKIAGQDFRYTGQTNEYKVTVVNPGTAPAKKVMVVATLPSAGGRLIALPDRAKFDKATRKLIWNLDQLEPGQSVDMTFTYGTSTPGLYRAAVEATSKELRAVDQMSTEVSGIAVLDLQVTQTARVIDVGKTTYYDITIKNTGTKDATRLQLSGTLTKNMKVLQFYNVEKVGFQFNTVTGQFLFPELESLAPGKSITVSLEVQATESGPAGAHVFLANAEMGADDAKVEDVISTTITGNSRPRPAPR